MNSINTTFRTVWPPSVACFTYILFDFDELWYRRSLLKRVCNLPILTNSMGKSPTSEANNHSDSREIPRLLWNPKVHYCIHKSPPLWPILSRINPTDAFPPFLSKIHSNVILPSTPSSSKCFLPFRLSDRNFVCISHVLHAYCINHTSHPFWFRHSKNILWSVQVMKLLIMQSSLASCRLLPLRSKYFRHPVLKHPQSMFLP
jgi:hypothetical protein